MIREFGCSETQVLKVFRRIAGRRVGPFDHLIAAKYHSSGASHIWPPVRKSVYELQKSFNTPPRRRGGKRILKVLFLFIKPQDQFVSRVSG
jgi:hypothetical protein